MSLEDATLALKGILGIASNNSTTSEKVSAKKSQTPPSSKKKQKSKPTAESTSNPKDSKKYDIKKAKEGVTSAKKSRGRNNKKEDQKAEGETYAWSSFQSPPDASSLPLPAFGSFDEVFIRDKKKDEGSSTTTTNGDSSTEKDNHGIDLAALAISDISESQEEGSKENSIPSEKLQNQKSDIEETRVPQDPLSMLMNPTYGTAVNNSGTMSPYSRTLHSTERTYMPTPPAYNHSLYQGALPPQPSFFSIQVQVPPNLLPGRRMMVHGPQGQPPISVVVPEGIQPGAFIPVTVPVPSYHFDPRFPYPQGIYPGQYPISPGMYMNQGYHHYLPPPSPNISHWEQKKSIPVPPTSWAEKVAASSNK